MTGRFQRGSGCYECHMCGKLTRETGESESSCDLCLLCYTKSGYGNQISDSGVASAIGVDPWKYFDNAKSVDEVYDLVEAAEKKAKELGWEG